MTTYTRNLTAEQLNLLRAVIKWCDQGDLVKDECRKALDTPVNGEALCMPIVCTGWNQRAAVLELPKKGAKREADREAYMQGALAALVAAGLMTVEHANRVAFMTAVGRLEDYMNAQAKKDVEASHA